MLKIILTNLFLLLALSACVSTLNNKGYIADDESMNFLKEGVATKNDVITIMGQPSIISDVGGDNFYYVSSKELTKTALSKKIQEQKIIAIAFDKDNLIKKITFYDSKDINQIVMSQDATKTAGDDDRITKKLFGNIGRFNKKKEVNKSGI